MMALNIFVIVVAYLLGSITFGLIIGKMKGVDIRKYGSGNIGTSNVGRILGKKAAIITLLGDGLKGLIAVLLARAILEGDVWYVAAGLAAVIGHNWPIYLKFKGGKGVTTTDGAFLGIAWLPALATILTWLLITGVWKKSSYAALISAPCAPLFVYLTKGFLPAGAFQPVMLYAVVTFILIYLRHTANIKRILAGKELSLTDKIDTSSEESEQ